MGCEMYFWWPWGKGGTLHLFAVCCFCRALSEESAEKERAITCAITPMLTTHFFGGPKAAPGVSSAAAAFVNSSSAPPSPLMLSLPPLAPGGAWPFFLSLLRARFFFLFAPSDCLFLSDASASFFFFLSAPLCLVTLYFLSSSLLFLSAFFAQPSLSPRAEHAETIENCHFTNPDHGQGAFASSWSAGSGQD